MNPKNDSDFAQFEGQFDFSQAPDPTFAEILRRRMDAERVDKPMQRATVVVSSPSDSPQVREKKPITSPPPSRRPIWAAMAAILVFAIIGVSVLKIGGLVNEGQHAGVPDVVLPADVSVTPGADVDLTSELLAPGAWLYQNVTVIGDVIVVSGSTGFNEDGSDDVLIYALDAQTGERLWEHHGWFGYSVVGDGESLYLLKEVYEWSSVSSVEESVSAQEEPFDPETTQTLAGLTLLAIEPRTGEIRWEYELPALTYPIELYMFWTAPMVVDGAVYIANWQSVVAVDATDGSQLWQVNTRFPTPENHNGMVGLATYNHHPVLVGTDGYVLVFAPETGNVVAHHQISLDTYFETIYGVDIEVATNEAGVIAMWNIYGPGDPQTVTMLIDPLVGEVQSSVITDASSGRSAFAADGSVAFVPNKWSPGNILMRILGRGGDTSFALVWVDALSGTVRLSTDYVRVSEYPQMIAANDGNYACYFARSFDCFDPTGTRYFVTNAVVYWSQAEDGRLYYFTDDGLFVVELP